MVFSEVRQLAVSWVWPWDACRLQQVSLVPQPAPACLHRVAPYLSQLPLSSSRDCIPIFACKGGA